MPHTNHGQPRIQQAAFKINDAATILGVAPSSIRRLIQRGVLKPCRVLRHALIPSEQIQQLLNS